MIKLTDFFSSEEKAPTPAPKPGEYIGCFKDTGNRDLTGQWTNGAWGNNVECMDKCAKGVSSNNIFIAGICSSAILNVAFKMLRIQCYNYTVLNYSVFIILPRAAYTVIVH